MTKETLLEVTFYMNGGHTVITGPVTHLEMKRDNAIGKYSGYSITWDKGKEPEFFSISIPDIVAVTAHKWQY